MKRCSITLLGGMQATLDGEPLQGLESAKVRALLAYLAVESGRAHERELLAGLFWPEMSEAQARHSLSQSLYNLHQALGEASIPKDLSKQPGSGSFILTTPHRVQFNSRTDHWLDTREFERCLSELRQHDHRRLETCSHCARLLQEAAQIYQGDFLAGLSLRGCQAFEEWALIWRERLHRQLCQALADLTIYYERRDELHSAIEVAERLAQVDPLSELAQCGVMRLLARSGQRTQALARYTSFRKLLMNELSVEPVRETQLLYERILAEESAQASLPGVPGRLPVPLTPFVGRQDELAELTAWLRDPHTRLVTLLGPGGSGKTRLALQAARSLRYDFPDGIFLVSLSGLGSSEAFLPALVSALNLVFQPSWGEPFEQLLGYLRGRRLLLVLDSFEEVLSATQWLPRLLQTAPGVKLLATSRTRLNLQPEQVFPLEGLAYPEPGSLAEGSFKLHDYAALELFHTTARQVRPTYTHNPADLPQVIRICQLVNGLPLGLVLAAGWLETLTPAEIAGEIEKSLDFLSSSWSDLPERQRSLRATLDHSWRMLEQDERQVFQRLSVFHGVFTRQAAQQVAGIDAGGLRRLVDKSMLQAGPGSYRMHDLLRQYAAEKLAIDREGAVQTRTAHSVYYLSRLPERTAKLKSAQRSATLRELDARVNDLQAAWGWACMQADLPLLAQSLEGLCLYYEMRLRYREGVQACQAALAIQTSQPEHASEAQVLRTRLLLWQTHFQVLLGELEAAQKLRQQAGELLDQLEAQGQDTRLPRAMFWQAEGEAQSALGTQLEYYQRSIALYQQLGEAWRAAELLVWVGELALRLGNPVLALQYQQEALRLARQMGEPNTLLYALRMLAYYYFILNQFENARQLMQEMTAYCDSVEELSLRATTQMNLGVMCVWSGQFAQAIQTLERTLPLLRSLGHRFSIVFGSLSLGIGYVLDGSYARAQAFAQTILPEAKAGGFLRETATILLTMGMAELAQGRLAQAEAYFQESIQRYRQMQFAGELGWALGGLALAQEAQGQSELATTTLVEALGIASATHSMFTMITCLAAMVCLLARRGYMETALLVHRVAMLQPVHQNSRWYANQIGDMVIAQWEALPAERRAEIDALARQHTPFSVLLQVLACLRAEPVPPPPPPPG